MWIKWWWWALTFTYKETALRWWQGLRKRQDLSCFLARTGCLTNLRKQRTKEKYSAFARSNYAFKYPENETDKQVCYYDSIHRLRILPQVQWVQYYYCLSDSKITPLFWNESILREMIALIKRTVPLPLSIISSDAHCLNYHFVVILGEMCLNWGTPLVHKRAVSLCTSFIWKTLLCCFTPLAIWHNHKNKLKVTRVIVHSFEAL